MEARLALGNALYKYVWRPHLFRKEAEAAHEATIHTLQRIQRMRLHMLVSFLYKSPYVDTPLMVGRVRWRNPVGIAAGFDKQCEVIPMLDAMGFGCIKVGTIVPRAQEGNPRPRAFRYPEANALVNRYGFNSAGAEVAAARLKEIHRTFTIRAPIGISVGKNKETPSAETVEDYLLALQFLLPVCRAKDYIQVNISSPNTPGLRETFSNLDRFLQELTQGIWQLVNESGRSYPPIYFKVPPDNLSHNDYAGIVKVVAHHRITAIEATNTTTRPEIKQGSKIEEVGGVSGEPLRKLSTRVLHYMKDAAEQYKVDLVGVGGISHPNHAVEKIRAGAKAVELYTGLVYEGPGLLHRILEVLYNRNQAARRIQQPFHPGTTIQASK